MPVAQLINLAKEIFCVSVIAGFNGIMKSTIAQVAIELRLEETVDCAAAKIPAITRPERPKGIG